MAVSIDALDIGIWFRFMSGLQNVSRAIVKVVGLKTVKVKMLMNTWVYS